jgi:hypothetical protein
MNGGVMEFASLRDRGLQLIQRLADAGWTDHNAHDPGITILEQVCYALTDLGYRTEYGLADLLTRNGEDSAASLYTPATILPSGPVNLTDLRKLVIDVPGVKNAWIETVDEPLAIYDAAQAEVSYLAAAARDSAARSGSPNVSEIRPRGLYRVRIEKSDLLDIDGGEIRRQAARRLHRFRGLGEDYAAIDVLDYQPVQIDATLEIRPAGEPIELLAAVYDRIASYCSPPVRFYTLTEMLDRGYRVDEIFEGPLLDHGFIDARELAQTERRASLRISDLIRELTAVPGVVAVKNVHFRTGGQRSRDWLLTVDPARTPRFDPDTSLIGLERGSLRVDSPALNEAAKRLFVERGKKAAVPARTAAADRDLRPAPGRDRRVGHYHSLQYEFPLVYGVGPAGLSQAASAERRAQAKQLKAYLMFYDQLLANHFAQLANVGRLFSFYDETADSYFSQAVQEDSGGPLALHEIRNGGPGHDAALRRITEDPASADDSGNHTGVRRRNRLLDHLLARFGEQFNDYAVLQLGLTAGGEPATAVRVAEDKRAFLRDYARIGRDRGVGFNVLAPAPEGSSEFLPGDVTNPAALRDKLSASASGSLSAFLWTQLEKDERYVLHHANGTPENTNAALLDVLNRVVDAGVSLYTDRRFSGVALSSETSRLLRQTPAVRGPDLVRLNRLLLEDAYPAEIARSRDEDNLAGIELALRRKLGIRDREERFHLVEHMLLRPIGGQNPLAGDAHQQGPLFRAAQVRDPYSLQVSFVFPSWPVRYRNPHFRQFVEETVREQLPAHLTAYVHWLEAEAMQAFEAAYAVWLHRWRNHRLADFEL